MSTPRTKRDPKEASRVAVAARQAEAAKTVDGKPVVLTDYAAQLVDRSKVAPQAQTAPAPPPPPTATT